MDLISVFGDKRIGPHLQRSTPINSQHRPFQKTAFRRCQKNVTGNYCVKRIALAMLHNRHLPPDCLGKPCEYWILARNNEILKSDIGARFIGTGRISRC